MSSTLVTDPPNPVTNFRTKLQEPLFWVSGLVLLLMLVLQVEHALQPPSLYHPDAIYQTLEPAHHLYYGYGFLSWEWLYEGGGVYTDPPATLGPYRSLITPYLFTGLFWLGESLGLSYWTTLTFIRVVMAFNFVLGMAGLALVVHSLEGGQRRVGGLLVLALTVFYPFTLLNGTRTLTNVIALTPLWWGLFLFLQARNPHLRQRINALLAAVAGFLLGVSLWLRPDFVLLLVLFSLTFFPYPFHLIKRLGARGKDGPSLVEGRKYTLDRVKAMHKVLGQFFSERWVVMGLFLGLGGLVSFVVNGLLDLFHWGEFAISLQNFAEFNKNTEYQSLFGTEPTGWYFEQYITARPALGWLWNMTVLVVAICIVLVVAVFGRYTYARWVRESKPSLPDLKDPLKFILLFAIVMYILDWSEHHPHKEVRYLLVWMFFLFATVAYGLALVTDWSATLLHRGLVWANQRYQLSSNAGRLKGFPHLEVTLLLTLVLAAPFFLSLNVENQLITWNSFDDLLAAQSWVGQQENVAGVIIVGVMWYDGGYTYLHQNVSVYHAVTSGTDEVFSIHFRKPNLYNYVLAPHYTYSYFPDLKPDLEDYGWVLVAEVLGRTDVWFHPGGDHSPNSTKMSL